MVLTEQLSIFYLPSLVDFACLVFSSHVKYTQCFFSLVYHAELYSGLMLFDVYISIFIYYISVVPYICVKEHAFWMWQ